MGRPILLFSYPDYLKDPSGKVTDVIEWLLASINEEELENEHRNHSHFSSTKYPQTTHSQGRFEFSSKQTHPS